MVTPLGKVGITPIQQLIRQKVIQNGPRKSLSLVRDPFAIHIDEINSCINKLPKTLSTKIND